jgi:acid stress-induced BolA-like protein IbaG/YrbA
MRESTAQVTNSEDDPNGTHVSIVCVSELFEGLSRVKRQQLVMRSIRDELDSGAIHAIDSLQTRTPTEATAADG